MTAGASNASPAATTRMAATSWSGGASLSRKPLAPAFNAHPDLRAQIEARALQTTARTTSAAIADGKVRTASLRTDLANAKAQNQNHRLRQQLRTLEQRLSETHGRDVAEQLGPDDVADSPDQLRAQLDAAGTRAFEIKEALADAREELDAVREINRELLTQGNRPAR